MTITLRPHDLIWLNTRDALEGTTESWVDAVWHTSLPVVVRRDVDTQGRIPVGVRGMYRNQRAAGWVRPDNIIHVCTPESLIDPMVLLCSSFTSQPQVQTALLLAQQTWPWMWGITGSTGYALATGIPVIHAESDLDLLIRMPEALSHEWPEKWQRQLTDGFCRADTQVETTYGAFTLNEWLRDGITLLKTSRGTRLVSDPWSWEE